MEEFKVFIRPDHLPATVVEITTELGTQVSSSDRLFRYEFTREVRTTKTDDSLVSGAVTGYKRTYDFTTAGIAGTVAAFEVQEGQVISAPDQCVVTLLVPCNHSRVILQDYCADCGEYWPSNNYVAFDHQESSIRISPQEADKVAKLSKDVLIESRKLIMVLDLDQTIIQATVDSQIGIWKNNEANVNYPALKNICTFRLPDKEFIYYVKPRNGLSDFLEAVYEKFELHVYTMGTRPYAEAVAKAIDPTSKYFGNRILSRDESGSYFKKDIRRLFPADYSMVVVLDDRPDVWNWSRHLIKVYPYEFFGVGDINSDSGKDKKVTIPDSPPDSSASSDEGEKEVDVEKPKLLDNDRELERLLVVIKELHRRYYALHDSYVDNLGSFMASNDALSLPPPDLSEVLTSLKVEVLGGVQLLLAGVLPPNVDPRSTELWLWAESFGARCHSKCNRSVTHVVALDPKNPEVRSALGLPGVNVLDLKWLYDSLMYWKRQPERHYRLVGLPPPLKARMEELVDSAFTPTPPFNGDTELECLEPALGEDELVIGEEENEEEPEENEDEEDEDLDVDQDALANLFANSSNWEKQKDEVDAELKEMGIDLSEDDNAMDDAEEQDLYLTDGLESDSTNNPKRGRSPSAIGESNSHKVPKILVTTADINPLSELNDEMDYANQGISEEVSEDCDGELEEEVRSDEWEQAIGNEMNLPGRSPRSSLSDNDSSSGESSSSSSSSSSGGSGSDTDDDDQFTEQ